MIATDFLQINAVSVLQSLQTSWLAGCLGIAGGKEDDFADSETGSYTELFRLLRCFHCTDLQ